MSSKLHLDVCDHLVNAYEALAGMMLFVGKTVLSMPKRLLGITFTFTSVHPLVHKTSLGLTNVSLFYPVVYLLAFASSLFYEIIVFVDTHCFFCHRKR